MTVVVAVAELFEPSGSPGEVDVTLTVFVSVPFCCGTPTIVTVAVAPEARSPSVQVIVRVREAVHWPCDVDTDFYFPEQKQRRLQAGHAEIDAYAEDYASLIFGLLELFQADADPAWLEWAIALQRRS